MKMRPFLFPVAAVLLISLMPHIADAATAPKGKKPQATPQKVKKYSVTMAKAHMPSAPNKGTDDYRCFLLDPKVKEDSIVRSIEFIPQRKDYVHHAIIFRVTEADIAEAIINDKSGNGWPCFGGTSLGGMMSTFITSPWISSWAPGVGKDIAPKGYGIPFKKGERFVLQVHYNLLAATDGKIETDQSTIRMEAVPAKGSKIKQLQLELFAAPVELACPPGITGPLCDRRQSLMDLASRTGASSAIQATALNAICGQNPNRPTPSLTSRCDRVMGKYFSIVAAGPHMHLLGRSLKMTLNPGREDAKVIIDVPNYNFDDQSAIFLKTPIAVNPGDTIRVECTFDPTLRQKIPQLKSLEPRYVTWGEGSSDEMCLGVLSGTTF
uniref:monooxygenase n=1 Tax=Candidatus Planktophila sp. TaxID=2175601 RepID=UPI0040492F80